MKLINKTMNTLQHGEHFLRVNAVEDIPEEIAKVWLKINGIEEYVEPADLAKLEKENEKLKKQLEAAKTATKITKAKTTKKAKK